MNKLLTILFGLGTLAFVYYVAMVLIGCISSMCGAGYDYFCGTYCRIALLVGIIAASMFVFQVFTTLHHKKAK
ncbi:hypothetical protein CLV93_101107 [Prolixibacter denitrificans]|uniref:Uncharacterized protein n=1 Tax=Prolixibacter denitrificans TaxID=1541063 RepID=A0A2P8CJL7_9BACT|nr:hypothetical protein CLV93_101107 [Prolixibacter denitrificans]